MIDLYDYVFNSEEDIPEKVVDETGGCIYAYRALPFEFFIQNKLGSHYEYCGIDLPLP